MPLDPSKYFTRRGWGLKDQCNITDGPEPYTIKLASLRDNNMLAFFVGPTPNPTTPTDADRAYDNLPDLLPTDVLIQGVGFDSNYGVFFDARYNPIKAQRDETLVVMFGGRYFLAMTASPPSPNALLNDKDSLNILPKDRIFWADFCNAGGVPCTPAVDIQAQTPTNWFNAPVGPPTLLAVPVNYGNGKLSKLPLDVTFSGCCIDDVAVSLIDPAGGVTFIQTSAGGTPLQDGYVSPTAATIPITPSVTFNVWLDYDDVILAPLVDVDGFYTFTIRFTTVNCGIYVATLKAPIVAPSGGYITLVSLVRL
jgi:hypothetical protein